MKVILSGGPADGTTVDATANEIHIPTTTRFRNGKPLGAIWDPDGVIAGHMLAWKELGIEPPPEYDYRHEVLAVVYRRTDRVEGGLPVFEYTD
jgi:hypothetical protein